MFENSPLVISRNISCPEKHDVVFVVVVSLGEVSKTRKYWERKLEYSSLNNDLEDK